MTIDRITQSATRIENREDRDRVDHLARRSGSYVAQPKMPALRDSLPKMECPNVETLGDEVGDHGRHHVGFHEIVEALERGGRTGYAARIRKNVTSPHEKQDEKVHEEPHPHNGLGAAPPVQFADEVGCEEGYGIREQTGGDDTEKLPQVHELRYPDDVPQRERGNEDRGEEKIVSLARRYLRVLQCLIQIKKKNGAGLALPVCSKNSSSLEVFKKSNISMRMN